MEEFELERTREELCKECTWPMFNVSHGLIALVHNSADACSIRIQLITCNTYLLHYLVSKDRTSAYVYSSRLSETMMCATYTIL